MLYANSPNGEKITATPGALGACPGCEDKLIPKCGELVTWHWSHYGHPDCDDWFEPESDWHRAWKGCFPPDQVEVVMPPHRADVIARRTVIEFQHSAIPTYEIRQREDFYTAEVGRLTWVFDAREFAGNLEFRYRDTWTELPAMVEFQATRYIRPPIYQSQCSCGAWRLRRAEGWEPCWSCGSSLEPKAFGPPHLGLRATRYASFVWKHRRPSHGACGQPLFWDLGNGWLFHVLTLHLDRPTAGFGRFLRQEAFIAWYGGQAQRTQPLTEPHEVSQRAAVP